MANTHGNTKWLDIIGIGEDGAEGLSPEALDTVEKAEIIIGGDRHHKLTPNVNAKRLSWPSPFDAMIDEIRSHRGKRLVILVTGDPLWFSVGARITRSIPAEEIRFHPQLSAFQFAACRMGWSLADVETLTVHGRPAEQIIPYFSPGARLLLLTRDGNSPKEVAQLLKTKGYPDSALTVLSSLGGPGENRIDGTARNWRRKAPDFHVLAVECVAGANAQVLPRTGLPDHAFVHDGKITKRTPRALALSKLVPLRGQLLWDVGCGCGSIAVEWMRGAPETRAIGIEPQAKRRKMAEQNALVLGTPRLELLNQKAPDALRDLPDPDAVFLGGGISFETIDASIARLRPFGRLVAHAVTLQSTQVLEAAFEQHGGELQRISVETIEPVGPYHGWKPSMPVMQWSWEKRP